METSRFVLLFVLGVPGMLFVTATEQVIEFSTAFPLNYDFSNTSGGKLSCNTTQQSDITISWILSDGSPISNVAKLREIKSDGSLVFPPFGAEDYRQDIHGVSYRCAAKNSQGILVSNEIKVKGVVAQTFDVHVYDVYAIKGNSAILQCHIPKFMQTYVKVTSWIKDSVLSITTSNLNADSKYFLLSTGELIVKDVDTSDDLTTFRCQVINNLTGEMKTSSNFGRLIVTDSMGKVPPKIMFSQPQISVANGKEIFIPCIASGNPTPTYLWSKQLPSGKIISVNETNQVQVTSTSLLIPKVNKQDEGLFTCTALNEVNSDKITIELSVLDSLVITITPSYVTVNANERLTLHCKVLGAATGYSLTWIKDGISLPIKGINFKDNNTLFISQMQSEHAGIYQCFAQNKFQSTFGTAIVKLGDTTPQIISGFKEVILNTGDFLELMCIAKGIPAPEIIWNVDNSNISNTIDTKINSLKLNEVVGSIIIPNIKIEDGGLYSCIAKNKAGEAKHTARINVKGKLGVRSNVKYLVTEEINVQLDCPIYGYPIKNIKWERNGKILPIHIRQKVHGNGSLTILNVQHARDNGKYICFATGNDDNIVKGVIQLVIMVPPKILPFFFQDDLIREGARARVQCVVSEGQSPLKIYWLKNNLALLNNQEQGLTIRHIDEFSSILMISSITSHHNGNYTCVATNVAGTAQHSASLFVNVAPKISPFFFRKDVFEGSQIRVSCVVYQGDLPLNLYWFKDGQQIDTSHTSVRNIDDYSSLLIIDNIHINHAGNYTCFASNTASTTSYSATLTVNVPPKVVPFTFQDDYLLEGMLVRVSCVVSRGDLPLIISWLKDDQAIPSELSVTIKDFDEYSSVLSIDPVTINHSGNYSCVAENHAGVSSHTAKLTVQVPPQWKMEPEDVIVKSGENIFVDCQADGYPKPTISWEKSIGSYSIDGRSEPILKSERISIFPNGTLSIQAAQQFDTGHYICLASNDIKDPLTKIIFIQVQAAPNFIKKDLKIFAKRGEKIKIPCEATGNWPLHYKWMSGNNQILRNFSGNRYLIEDLQDEETAKSISTLSISWVDRKDSNSYVCHAKNNIGESQMTIKLIVQEKPDAPTIKSPVKVVNQTFELTWVTNYNGNSEIKAYHIQIKKEIDRWTNKTETISLSGSKNSTKIAYLKPFTLYTIRIKAENIIGNGSFSEIVLAKTEEAIPGGPPENVDVESTDANTLRVSWKPPQKSLWNGAICGYNIGYKEVGNSDSFFFQSLEVPEDYTEEVIYQLTDLKMYTQYKVVVQAFNSKGNGPLSQPQLAMTSEDVPSSAPIDIRCSPLSSKSIYIIWESPDSESINGILRGYKILYKPSEQWYDGIIQSQVSQVPKITLNNLEVNTNYSIQVLAYTKMGDGVKSHPIFCKTHEDVPEPPEVIKVLPSSSDSVIVAWKPPKRINGALLKYNIYYTSIDEKKEIEIENQNIQNLQRDAKIFNTQTNTNFVELKQLEKNRKYAFWVTATSAIGESAGSSIVAQTVADSIVAAKTASFDTVIKSPWKEDVILPCNAVGVPIPNRKWIIQNQDLKETSRIKINLDGSVIINNIVPEDSGNYSCIVYNEYGRDEVIYAVTVQIPPSTPIMELVSKTRSSIKLQWKPLVRHGESVRGYILHYKQDNGIWQNKELMADESLITLEKLNCGSTYHLYLEAFNEVGTGIPSDTIIVTTDGADVIAPAKENIIREGSSFITVYLNEWPTNACPVKNFAVEYKAVHAKEWINAGSNIKPSQIKLVISGLSPATWYILRIKAETSSTPTMVEYRFATHTTSGGTLPPEVSEQEAPIYIFHLDPLIFIPAVVLFVVVIAAIVVTMIVCCCSKKRNEPIHLPTGNIDYADGWDKHVQTLPRGQFIHSNLHSTLGTCRTDPSPYATAQLMDFSSIGQCATIRKGMPHKFQDQLQQAECFLPQSGMTESAFVLNENKEPGYDEPPLSHMFRN